MFSKLEIKILALLICIIFSSVKANVIWGVDRDECSKLKFNSNIKYVSINGNDANADGSINKPYRSLYSAVLNANSGDTILVRGGVYKENREIRIRVPNITISSYPGEWAIIDRTSSGGPNDWDSGIYLDVDSDRSTIECLEVKGGFYTISTETKWDWDEDDKMGATNITISNVKLHESYADVVKVKPNSDNFKISYSEIYNSGIGQKEGECNAEGIDNVNADNMIASHLYIHNICSTGIYFKGGSTKSEISYSFIENTGEAGIMLGFDTSPEYFDKSVNSNMYEAINCSAHHNLIKNSKFEGIGLYASYNSSIYNNTIINSASFAHSPIYFGLSFQDWDSSAKRPPNNMPNIYNNIIYQDITANSALFLSIRHSDELGGLDALNGSLNIDNNCYFQKVGSNKYQFYDQRGNEWYGNLQEWKNYINADKQSVMVDPNLDSNYIARNKLCKDKGHNVNSLSKKEILIIDLFIAAYGRVPTKKGLDFFAKQLKDNKMTKKDIINYMFDINNNYEALQRYPVNMPIEDKINTIFKHILGRTVATLQGMDFWKNLLKSNKLSIGELVFNVIESAKEHFYDKKVLELKENIAIYFINTTPKYLQANNQIYIDNIINLKSYNSAKELIDKLNSN